MKTTKEELDAKLKSRADRFGIAKDEKKPAGKAGAKPAAAPAVAMSAEEKAKLEARAKRFAIS